MKKITDITLKMTFEMCINNGIDSQWVAIDHYFSQTELDKFRNGAGDLLAHAYEAMRKKLYWKHFMGEEADG